jgi:hypothetical protein
MGGSFGTGGTGGTGGSGGTGGTGGSGGSGGSGGTGGSKPDAGRVDSAAKDAGPGDAPAPDDAAIDQGSPDAGDDVTPPDAPDGGTSDIVSDAGVGFPVLYVIGSVGGPVPSDTTLVDRLIGRGYEVTTKTDADVTAADAQGKAAVLLSASTTAGRVMTNFPELPGLATPVLAMDENLEPLLDFTGAAGTQHGATAGTQVTILAAADAMFTAGLSGNVTVYNASFSVGWGIPGTGALKVATIVGTEAHVAIYAYPPGTAMANNRMAPAKRAFYFVRDSPTPNIITEEALRLFDAEVDWITRP